MKNLWNRFLDLVAKNLGLKAEIFWIATVLLLAGRLDTLTWGFFAAGFAGIRTLEKWIGVKKPITTSGYAKSEGIDPKSEIT